MFGKSVPSTTRSATSTSRAGQSRGSGANCSVNGGADHRRVEVHAARSGATRSSAPSYSGMPGVGDHRRQPRVARPAPRRTSPGRCARRASGRCRSARPPGTPASASSPQTGSSSGSRGSYPPTCTCALNTRAPASSAAPTYVADPARGRASRSARARASARRSRAPTRSASRHARLVRVDQRRERPHPEPAQVASRSLRRSR